MFLVAQGRGSFKISPKQRHTNPGKNISKSKILLFVGNHVNLDLNFNHSSAFRPGQKTEDPSAKRRISAQLKRLACV